uniref:Uncharacterized protein n=1 Tax=Arion vulgaris TaxID=1028688 RepID=A0A0B7BDP8_9EUPU
MKCPCTHGQDTDPHGYGTLFGIMQQMLKCMHSDGSGGSLVKHFRHSSIHPTMF